MTDSNDPDTATTIGSMTIEGYLSALNSKAPTPGGGAVAGTTGATAAAIAGMVLHYTLGKNKFADYEHDNQSHLDWITEAQSRFLSLADDDAKGYAALNALWPLPESDPKRAQGWHDAVLGAIVPPIEMLALSVELIKRVEKLVLTTNTHLKSDLAVAAVVCRAAGHSAACNIRINVPLLPEDQQPGTLATTQESLDVIDALCACIQEACA